MTGVTLHSHSGHPTRGCIPRLCIGLYPQNQGYTPGSKASAGRGAVGGSRPESVSQRRDACSCSTVTCFSRRARPGQAGLRPHQELVALREALMTEVPLKSKTRATRPTVRRARHGALAGAVDRRGSPSAVIPPLMPAATGGEGSSHTKCFSSRFAEVNSPTNPSTNPVLLLT